jgi:hypothetical protein
VQYRVDEEVVRPAAKRHYEQERPTTKEQVRVAPNLERDGDDERWVVDETSIR